MIRKIYTAVDYLAPSRLTTQDRCLSCRTSLFVSPKLGAPLDYCLPPILAGASGYTAPDKI